LTIARECDELWLIYAGGFGEAVRNTVRDLSRIAEDLEDEADNIRDVQTALSHGAQAVQRFTNLVAQLRTLAPVA